ncbi:MAG: hypothetical protein M1548_07790 [Actinobacteria bacterium]|nr:hypothetical protein [Actinomycetota bacterium]
MKKIIIGSVVLALALLLSWSYSAVSQRQDSVNVQGKSQQSPAKAAEYNDLAKKLIIDQQNSRENMRRLAEGQIKNIDVIGVNQNDKQVFIKAFYTDQSSLDGIVYIDNVQDKFYMTQIRRLSNAGVPGQMASIGPGEMKLGDSLVQTQADNQEVFTDLLNGTISKIVFNNTVKKSNENVTIEGTVFNKDGTTEPVTIDMVFLNGFWYVKSAAYE